ncbi:hypothetical protein KDN24_04800 [Bacillus sp. Bva_UNVM-123]|uniref:hypothetical protein n=1 Tax=Bacillus sp. Bva_UNVM-123 TaxID=2829798 RepID=UPI00391EFB89
MVEGVEVSNEVIKKFQQILQSTELMTHKKEEVSATAEQMLTAGTRGHSSCR